MKPIFLTLDFESYFDQQCSITKLGTSMYVKHPDFYCTSVAMKTRGGPCRSFGGPAKVAAAIEAIKPFQDQIVLFGHNLYFDAFVLSHHFNFIPAFYIDTYCMGQALHAHEGPLDLDTLSKLYGDEGKKKGVLDNWKGLHWDDATPEQRAALLEYNEIDTERTESLALQMLKKFPRFELKVIDLTLRLFTDPVFEVDKELAKQILVEVETEKAQKAEEVRSLAPPEIFTQTWPTKELARAEVQLSPFKGRVVQGAAGWKVQRSVQAILRSNDQYAALLGELGYDVPMKWSDKQACEIPAVANGDLSYQRFVRQGDARLKAIAEARKVCKSSIYSSRAKALIERSDHPFPIGLMYHAAHTMRWGGTDKVNPQNMPRKGRLRHCLRAPNGHVLVIVDASQIEARDNATFSEQWDLVDAFAAGEDVYCTFASEVYNRPIDKDNDPDERFVGKTAILGLGFNMGGPKFRMTLEVGAMGPPVHIDEAEAIKIVRAYRSRYSKIAQHWRELQNLIPMMLESGQRFEHRGVVFNPNGTIDMPNGLSLHYPNLDYTLHPEYGSPEFFYEPWDAKRKRFERKKLYGGLLLENLVQCRARIMTTGHMLELAKRWRVVMMAHDEIVMCVPLSLADECLSDALEVMSIAPEWNSRCPLKAEGHINDHYVK